MRASLTVPPAGEPLTLAEAKLHLRVDLNDDDALITALISAAREQVEFLTGQRLITQTWELELAAGERGGLEGLLPIQSLTSASAYNLDGRWPPTLTTPQAATVTVICGFGNAQAVPSSIRQWMLLRIGTWYEQREALVSGTASELPRGFADALLDPWRVPRC